MTNKPVIIERGDSRERGQGDVQYMASMGGKWKGERGANDEIEFRRGQRLVRYWRRKRRRRRSKVSEGDVRFRKDGNIFTHFLLPLYNNPMNMTLD